MVFNILLILNAAVFTFLNCEKVAFGNTLKKTCINTSSSTQIEIVIAVE